LKIALDILQHSVGFIRQHALKVTNWTAKFARQDRLNPETGKAARRQGSAEGNCATATEAETFAFAAVHPTVLSLRLARPKVLGEDTRLEDRAVAFAFQSHSLASLNARRNTRERVGLLILFVSQTHATRTRNDTARNRSLLVLFMKNNEGYAYSDGDTRHHNSGDYCVDGRVQIRGASRLGARHAEDRKDDGVTDKLTSRSIKMQCIPPRIWCFSLSSSCRNGVDCHRHQDGVTLYKRRPLTRSGGKVLCAAYAATNDVRYPYARMDRDLHCSLSVAIHRTRARVLSSQICFVTSLKHLPNSTSTATCSPTSTPADGTAKTKVDSAQLHYEPPRLRPALPRRLWRHCCRVARNWQIQVCGTRSRDDGVCKRRRSTRT